MIQNELYLKNLNSIIKCQRLNFMIYWEYLKMQLLLKLKKVIEEWR